VSALSTRLASLRLTLAGIAALIATVLATYRSGGTALYWVALPLALLALNLLAAILTNRAFRLQSALLVFHVGLLAVLLLAAAGLFARFEGRVELVEGERFDAGRVETIGRGWLHRDRLASIDVEQGSIEVDYRAGLQRAATRSELLLAGERRLVGDRVAAEIGGYRLLATFNKGYALVLVWDDGIAKPTAGAMNFPSFPEFEWKQRNAWTTPAGEALDVELVLPDRVPERGPWTLRRPSSDFEVVVRRAGRAAERVGPGGTLALRGGRLTVAELRLWMGYRIDANPLLPWTLAAAFLALGALAVHFLQKFGQAETRVPGRAGAAEQVA